MEWGSWVQAVDEDQGKGKSKGVVSQRLAAECITSPQVTRNESLAKIDSGAKTRLNRKTHMAKEKGREIAILQMAFGRQTRLCGSRMRVRLCE